MLNHVFVYGTLKNGMSNDRPLYREARKSVQNAAIQGTLLDMGFFPGIVLEGTTPVRGEVHTYPKEKMPELIEAMDRLEGYSEKRPDDSNFYNRRTADVLLENGEKLKVYLYEVNRRYLHEERATIIKSGIWEPKR
jgi:gamma-glutamylcyclotransferase (GGCT)/AIG2-like uncharacterized protein YtfP